MRCFLKPSMHKVKKVGDKRLAGCRTQMSTDGYSDRYSTVTPEVLGHGKADK